MSSSSWFFKSSLASTFFKPAPEGKIFVCPSPWIFGKQRAYRLTDAQAEQVVARVGRAFAISMIGFTVAIIAAITAGLGFVYAMSADPDLVFANHPIAYWGVMTLIVLVLVAANLLYLQSAVGSVVRGLPWTPVAREPYSLSGNLERALKQTVAFQMAYPTWLLVTLFVIFIIALPFKASLAFKALADGRWTQDVLLTVLFLVFTIETGAALVLKRKAQREG